MSNKKSPRWINEIPGINNTGKKILPTEESKKKAKDFEEAVKKGKISEWFNKEK